MCASATICTSYAPHLTEFYNQQKTEYQESFVVHIRHAKITLFYAKLPNLYLSRITQHGAKYATTFHDKVQLYQSQPFLMKKAADQAANGNSHVGYLCNYPQNPFIAKPVFLM